jgi:hypothetical protein
VSRRARLVAFPPVLGVNADRIYSGEVQKGPQHPTAQVSGRLRRV